jgi:hypothetical protein
MLAGNSDVSGGSIDADDTGAPLNQWLGDKPRATADVENSQTVERDRFGQIPTKTARNPSLDASQADGIESMYRPKSTIRIPPFLGERRETFDLLGIDSRGQFERPVDHFRLGLHLSTSSPRPD